ncbi:MAG: hypothetical protein ABW221_20115, partial [Vicinamibacteria bacterium]
YLGLALWTYATGVQGLVFGQAAASVAVVCYFLRNRHGHSIWRVVVAPASGAAGLRSHAVTRRGAAARRSPADARGEPVIGPSGG